MDYLQYEISANYSKARAEFSFKPYYKWITFNTKYKKEVFKMRDLKGFKPYYKWITFNTLIQLEIQKMSHKF